MSLKKVIDAIITVVLCAWVASQLFSWSQPVTPSNEADLTATIEKTWTNLKNKKLIHGAILIKKGNEVLFSDGNLEQVHSIASISKSFVGMGFFRLEQKGLNLDTPVCQWLNNFCTGDLKEISLRHLLAHRSGFGRDLSFLFFIKRTVNPDWDIKNIDSLVLEDSDLKSKPGEKFRYSNFGYIVLSRLWEIIADKDFSLLVSDLAQAANLKQTASISQGDVFPIKVMIPYTDISWDLKLKTILYRSAGTGGIKSSAQDLMAWIEYLNKNNFNSVFKSPKQNYSHGWVRSEDQSYQAYWHNGAALGSYSFIGVIPNSDLKVVILTDNFKYAKQWSNLAEQFEQYFF